MLQLYFTRFGMGCSCLQMTFQAQNINEARQLYDQLTPLCPIVVSKTLLHHFYQYLSITRRLGKHSKPWKSDCCKTDIFDQCWVIGLDLIYQIRAPPRPWEFLLLEQSLAFEPGFATFCKCLKPFHFCLQLALSAASPVQRGYLADIDCRWTVIAQSVDDRTKEELGQEVCYCWKFRLVMVYLYGVWKTPDF